mmetsp:Transcript_48150/g.92037  ORF Transcript_48150/g.92037 Transcript_48150/m.92037 type:complete len:259 (+) Transcript_48150:117-893(+)
MSEDGFPVTLHIYDLSGGLAAQLSLPFLGKQVDGIWHTGVVAYGSEYFFGGGIQRMPPGTTPYGRPMQVVQVGTSHLPQEVFEEYLMELSTKYNAETYNLLNNNCNNFSDDVASFLTGNHIPPHITGLPSEVLNTPLGSMLAPMIAQMENNMRNQGQATMVNPAQPIVPPAAPAQRSEAPARAVETTTADSNGSQKETQKQPQSASVASTSKEHKAEFQKQVQAEFVLVMGEKKISANEAAAEAIKRVTARNNLKLKA